MSADSNASVVTGDIVEWKVGPATCAVVAPGQCQFTENWTDVPLLEKIRISPDTFLFTFGLPDATRPLGLSTCACIVAKLPNSANADGVSIRPYTPISTNDVLGQFQLLIKIYPDGEFTSVLNQLTVGGTCAFKHVPFNVKRQYPFEVQNIGMVVGGTGITPMIQALHAILGNADDKTNVTLLLGNKTEADILGRQLLDQWSASNPQLKVVYVLSREPADSTCPFRRGRVDKTLAEEHLAPPNAEGGAMVMVCGPSAMYTSACGARGDAELSGFLLELGYTKEQVFKC